MKEENLKFLETVEPELITALWYDYSRNLPTSTLKELDRIYTEETKNTHPVNYGCGKCILGLLKRCSRLYFKELPERIPEDLKDRIKI